MEETQIEETSTEEQTVEPVVEEKTPMDLLFDEMDALKARIEQLEGVAHSGHELNEHAISHIASVVISHINNGIRNRFGKRA